MLESVTRCPRTSRTSRMDRLGAAAAAGLLAALVLALGIPANALAGGPSVKTGPVHGKIVGQNHHPIVNKNWSFTVTVTNASGRPLAGTVTIEFSYNGVVEGYDTPRNHTLKHGVWHETLTFPADAEGYPLDVQAVAHTKRGSITLDWSIIVKA